MGAVESLKQPEYTGENRCTPCTVVNVGIAAVAAIVATAFGRPFIGTAILVAALGAIYFRGYLVPGTPELTKRYLPASVLRLFGKEPVSDRTFGSIDAGAGTETQLVAAGALTDAETPELTDSFAAAWASSLDDQREGIDEGELRTLLGTDDVSKHADTGAVVDGTQSVRWISSAAMAADVAAGRVLAERVDGWAAIEPSDRVELLRALRLFVRNCPACGGDVEREERTVDPCCDRPHTLVDVTCSACGVALGDAAVVGIDEESPAHVRSIRN